MKGVQGGGDQGGAGQGVTAFVGIVAAMSRFLTGLAGAAPFKDAELSLAEWATLSVIAERDAVNNKQLGRSLGITRQRVNQITDSLKQSSLISVEPSASDGRVKVIHVTDEGKSQLATVNAGLAPRISALLTASPGGLPRIQRALRSLTAHFIDPADTAAGHIESSVGSDAQAR